ncbi:MAG: NACHT domain-containing protein [Gammaproteobacteria bacterium]|nr:NACHT domain-containing protein [Gammaproteobacteria bacterium]
MMPDNPFNSILLSWVLFFFFIAVCITAAWAFIYWWKKDHHTRERFAFFGAISLGGVIILLLTQLMATTSLFAAPMSLILKWFNISYQAKSLSSMETAVYMTVLFLYGFWFYKIFTNWGGQKSKGQYEQEQNRLPPSVLTDIRLIISRDREKLAPHQEEVEPGKSLLKGMQDTRAWYQQARDLWELRHRHRYLFENEYDPVYKCWWGEEKKTGTQVCLACHHEPPPDSEIKELADYARKVAQAANSQAAIEIILACKEGALESYEQTEGYTLQWINQAALLDKLVDFSDYFANIRYRVERNTLPDSKLTLQNTYVPSRYRFTAKSKAQPGDAYDTNNFENYLQAWLTESSPRQLALLGEYGQGKSTASLWLCYLLIQQAERDPRVRIPILLELRGKSPRNLTQEALLAEWAYPYSINPKALMQLLIAGRILLIFEGFDEIDLTGDTESRLNHFRTLWRFTYPQAKILITGRPNFFLDDSERKRALGIEEPHTERPYCQTIFLAPFNTRQIEHSLRSADENTRNEIIELAERDQKFYEIVSRPSLLHIVSTLWKRENLSAQKDHVSSALVMDLFIRHSYRRQGAKQAQRRFMALNTAERAYFMAGIAAYMGAKGLPNQISQQDLEQATDQLIDAIPSAVSKSVSAMENEVSLPLKHHDRFDWENKESEVREHIKNDVRSCAILVTDVSKNGTFKFAHKSFMEFLHAQVLSRRFVSDEAMRTGAVSILNTWDLEPLISLIRSSTRSSIRLLTDSSIRLSIRTTVQEFEFLLFPSEDSLAHSPETDAFFAELLQEELRTHGITQADKIAEALLNVLILEKLTQHSLMDEIKKQLLSKMLTMHDYLLGRYLLMRQWNKRLRRLIGRLSGLKKIFKRLLLSLLLALQELLMRLLLILLLLLLFEYVIDTKLARWFCLCKHLTLPQEAIENTVGKNITVWLKYALDPDRVR